VQVIKECAANGVTSKSRFKTQWASADAWGSPPATLILIPRVQESGRDRESSRTEVQSLSP
jgi:hypothetical protein